MYHCVRSASSIHASIQQSNKYIFSTQLYVLGYLLIYFSEIYKLFQIPNFYLCRLNWQGSHPWDTCELIFCPMRWNTSPDVWQLKFCALYIFPSCCSAYTHGVLWNTFGQSFSALRLGLLCTFEHFNLRAGQLFPFRQLHTTANYMTRTFLYPASIRVSGAKDRQGLRCWMCAKLC